MIQFCLVFSVIFFAVVTPMADAASCSEKLNLIRVRGLRELSALESSFVEMAWQYQKYREAVYVPLWQATLQTRDRFTRSERVQGEVLRGRYQSEAGTYLQKAKRNRRSMNRHWKNIQKQTEKMVASCEVIAFRDCMQYFFDHAEENLRLLQKQCKRYLADQDRWNEDVQKSLEEVPGDHTNFSSRFRRRTEEWEAQFYPVFLATLRILRESFEQNESDAACCASCERGETLMERDPIVKQLKPDLQPEGALAGKVTNRATLTRAYEAFKEREKQTAS